MPQATTTTGSTGGGGGGVVGGGGATLDHVQVYKVIGYIGFRVACISAPAPSAACRKRSDLQPQKLRPVQGSNGVGSLDNGRENGNYHCI